MAAHDPTMSFPIPKTLRETLRADAKKNGRSASAQIRLIIAKHYEAVAATKPSMAKPCQK